MRYVILATLIVACTATGATAQEVNKPTDTQQILSELQQIRTLLERNLTKPSDSAVTNANGQGAAQRAVNIDVGKSPMLGNSAAPVTIVEFTDFQCPFCNRFYEQTFPELKRRYIDSGEARFYVMNLPLGIHANALVAAEAGECAHAQGQFWNLFDLMQKNPDKLSGANENVRFL